MGYSEVSRGRIEIAESLNSKEIMELVRDNSLKVIQFSHPGDFPWKMLDELLFSKRQDVALRIYGFYSDVCDLSFLSELNNLCSLFADCLMEAKGINAIGKLHNLESLSLGIYNLDNFDILNHIPKTLKALFLGATKSKKPDLAPLERFNDLEKLYIEGQHKNIEVIGGLSNLGDVTLRSITTPDIKYLSTLKKLWSLDIKLGGIKNFSDIEGMENIKYLELWQIRGLNDVSFVSSLVGLQYLYLQSLPNITRLPSFNKLVNLRRVYLENMKGLKDLSSLEVAPALEEFIHYNAGNMNPEDYIPVLKNPLLQMATCGMGSDKKNKAFAALRERYGINATEWSEFKFN